MFIENKYKKIYFDLCSKNRNFKENEYFEKHHIIPKCMGGTNESINIVKLTYREHFVAHKLLTKFTQGMYKRKAYYALTCMSRRKDIIEKYNIKINSRYYEEIRKAMGKARKGNNHTKEAKEKQRQIRLKFFEDHPEMRKQISEKNKGRPNPKTKEVWNKHVATLQKRYGVTNISQLEWVKEKKRKKQKGVKRAKEIGQKISKANKGKLLGDKNPMKNSEISQKIREFKTGRIWIKNYELQKLKTILPEEFPEYENYGWVRGNRL